MSVDAAAAAAVTALALVAPSSLIALHCWLFGWCRYKVHWENSDPSEDEWFNRDDLLQDFPETVRRACEVHALCMCLSNVALPPISIDS